MAGADLETRVKKMAEYLDVEAIAAALKMPVETISDILDGKAEIKALPAGKQLASPVVQVNTARVAYRQRVIAVWRAKGGVGCTAVALYLAWLLKDMLRVLLIDLNFAAGGSDLSYYLNLPEYPHIGGAEYDLEQSLINVEEGFYVLQAPRRLEEVKTHDGLVTGIINYARPAFDVIIFDLPNSRDICVTEAVLNATTVIFVTAGSEQEVVRAALRARNYPGKECFLLANGSKLNMRLARDLGFERIIEIQHDPGLREALENGDVLKKNSPFMAGMTALRDSLYENPERKGGIFKKLLAR
ncbi:AAA family ATPase [Moorella naiadis]|uniref:AAA family ATPase n=1 Tax=Moorella naiadis (nom. illeg.) TaxID=3093670 RepID=UPI003D9CAFF6